LARSSVTSIGTVICVWITAASRPFTVSLRTYVLVAEKSIVPSPNGKSCENSLSHVSPTETASPSSGRIGVSCPMPGNPNPWVSAAPPSDRPPAESTRPSDAIWISIGGAGVDGTSLPFSVPLMSETVTSIVAVPASSTETTFQPTTCETSIDSGSSPNSGEETFASIVWWTS
jgi:hypothetical protein